MADYVQKKVQAATFLLIDTVIALFDDSLMPDCLVGNEEITALKQYILDTTLSLDEIAEYEPERTDVFIKDMLNRKSRLIEIGKSGYTYSYANNLTKALTGHYGRLLFLNLDTSNKNRPINTSAFFSDCMKYIKKENGFVEPERKADVISCFPVRMTKQRYADHVKTGLYQLMKNFPVVDCAGFIEIMCLKFYPFDVDCYGHYFTHIKDNINRIFNSQFENFDTEQFQKSWDELDAISDEINSLINYFELMYDALVFLPIILNFAPGFDFITGDNMLYKDTFFAFKENFDKEDFEAIEDRFSSTLNDITDNLTDECLQAEKMIEDMLDKDENSSTLNPDFVNVYEIIKRLYKENLLSLCFPLSQNNPDFVPKTYYDSVEKSIDALIEYINKSMTSLSNSRQKIIKQFFLEIAPCFMDDEEFLKYLQYSFDETSAYHAKLMIVDSIGRMFNEKGFIDTTEEQHSHHHAHDHSHHHHDHDCDCGHHH